jgi:hypothetical protein
MAQNRRCDVDRRHGLVCRLTVLAESADTFVTDTAHMFPQRSHDERVLVKSFRQGQEYLYRLVKMLAGGK